MRSGLLLQISFTFVLQPKQADSVYPGYCVFIESRRKLFYNIYIWAVLWSCDFQPKKSFEIAAWGKPPRTKAWSPLDAEAASSTNKFMGRTHRCHLERRVVVGA